MIKAPVAGALEAEKQDWYSPNLDIDETGLVAGLPDRRLRSSRTLPSAVVHSV